MIDTFGRLRGRLVLLVAGSSVVALGVLALLVVPSLQDNLEQSRLNNLRVAALGAQGLLRGVDSVVTPQNQVLGAAETTNARVLVYRPGVDAPLFDSRAAAPHPSTPPLVADALRNGGVHSDVGAFQGRQAALVAYPFSSRTGEYVALFAMPLSDVHDAVSAVVDRILLGAAIALVIAVALGLGAADLLTRRLIRLRHAAERIASGRFDVPVVDPSSDEIGDLARALEAMRARLLRLDRTRSEFIANASHELRTPLTSLGGYLELIDEGDLDDATREEFLETMRDQLDRLERLASDLLDLSRLDAGGVEVGREELSLGDVAHAAVREAQPLAVRCGSQLVLEDVPHALVFGDEARVLQIARALIDNALRHTPPGTTVRVSIEPGDRVALRVADDGPGIPDEALAHVFERFYRGPGASPRGSGLGLAIARELAERMGGALRVRSAPGRTVFTLELAAAIPTLAA